MSKGHVYYLTSKSVWPEKKFLSRYDLSYSPSVILNLRCLPTRGARMDYCKVFYDTDSARTNYMLNLVDGLGRQRLHHVPLMSIEAPQIEDPLCISTHSADG